MGGWSAGTRRAKRMTAGCRDGYEQPATEPLETIIDALCALGPAAVGIMHSSLPSTTPGLQILFERWSGPVMAYPEATGFDAETRRLRGPVPPEDFADHCRAWVESGVQIIGGCCGTTIHHIRAMVDRLPAQPGPRPTPDRERGPPGSSGSP